MAANEAAGPENDPSYLPMLSQLRGMEAGGQAVLARFAADVRALRDGEIATRRLLAEEVYGVPEEWLDEVIRVRLAELKSD